MPVRLGLSVSHQNFPLQNADDSAVRAVHAFSEPAQAVEVTEELVSAVDEVNDHFEFAEMSAVVVRLSNGDPPRSD
jgi:hypothetical protein